MQSGQELSYLDTIQFKTVKALISSIQMCRLLTPLLHGCRLLWFSSVPAFVCYFFILDCDLNIYYYRILKYLTYFTFTTLLPLLFGPVYSDSRCLISFYYYCFIEIPVVNANSVDPDQKQHSAMSNLGLHCFPFWVLHTKIC